MRLANNRLVHFLTSNIHSLLSQSLRKSSILDKQIPVELLYTPYQEIKEIDSKEQPTARKTRGGQRKLHYLPQHVRLPARSARR